VALVLEPELVEARELAEPGVVVEGRVALGPRDHVLVGDLGVDELAEPPDPAVVGEGGLAEPPVEEPPVDPNGIMDDLHREAARGAEVGGAVGPGLAGSGAEQVGHGASGPAIVSSPPALAPSPEGLSPKGA
jgi:hypothetical protein